MSDVTALANALAVYNHLRELGHKVSRGTVYNHINNGLLKPTAPGGGWLPRAVETYAKAKWPREVNAAKPTKPEQGRLDDASVAEERQRAEIALKQTQNERQRLKLQAEQGTLIPRDIVERELAMRGQAFRFGLENEIHKAAPEIAELFGADSRVAAEIVRLVGGDEAKAVVLSAWVQKRVPELVHFWQRRVEEFLAPYASGDWWNEDMAAAMKPKETSDAGPDSAE
ncbi:hypothetical protein [Desulfocurvibacter africanus]|uniref:Uncharacterized protein n=1 Tax=Desulfocurvibacter africanus subsp. africanus str. Walvis Bay TaxID=690850 RepID=F3Z2S0_DESAF|nr:hypothetical protein [Desulfocurvibacter africanus]EGJ50237.1 hypothetical protein Desaf_1908 [Desulfocurvibacter africanus subsp. africanus str. Walvis Bay]